MKGVRSGNLDRVIEILRPGASTDDGYTTQRGALALYIKTFADWQPMSGREVFENMGREAKFGGHFYIRHSAESAAIKMTDKVRWDGVEYDIVANDPYDRNEKRRLTVIAGDD